jgi:hypothetical protein
MNHGFVWSQRESGFQCGRCILPTLERSVAGSGVELRAEVFRIELKSSRVLAHRLFTLSGALGGESGLDVSCGRVWRLGQCGYESEKKNCDLLRYFYHGFCGSDLS